MALDFVAGAGLAEVVMRFAQKDGELAVNVFGVDSGHGAGLTQADCVALADGFATWFNTGDGSHDYRDVVSDSAYLLDVTARDLTTQTSPEGVANVGLAGEDTGQDLANGVTFTLTSHTALTGKWYRGRTYLIGLTETFVSSTDVNVADAAVVGQVTSAFNSLVTAVAAITLPDASTTPALAVFSRWSGGLRRADVVATPITAYGSHDLFLDYQRRRAPGHNRHH